MQVRRGWILNSWGLCLAFFAAVCGCTDPRASEQRIASPKGDYEISLTGTFARPRGLFRAKVQGAVRHDGHIYGQFGVLRDTDSRDESFDELYPRHSWIGPNILQFPHRPSTTCDVLEVENVTGKTIRALSVQVGDLLLAFALPPNFRKTVLIVPSDDPSGVYVVATADVDDRQPLHASATIERNMEPAITNYVVRVTHSDIVIARTQGISSPSDASCRNDEATGGEDAVQPQR